MTKMCCKILENPQKTNERTLEKKNCGMYDQVVDGDGEKEVEGALIEQCSRDKRELLQEQRW